MSREERKRSRAGKEAAGLREAKRADAETRDRVRLLAKGPGGSVAWIAILTAVFEAAGFLVALQRPGSSPSLLAPELCLAVVLSGLFTVLILPRFLPLDPLLMALVNFLCSTGMVVLLTVSCERGERQMAFYLAGLVFMSVMSLAAEHLRHPRMTTAAAMALGLALLCAPLALGEWVNGAKNWIKLVEGTGLQPSEFVKVSPLVVLAAIVIAIAAITFSTL